jgi:hypothetical protein
MGQKNGVNCACVPLCTHVLWLRVAFCGFSYPLEDTLARMNRLGSLLSNGTPGQQKCALSLLFSHIDVDLNGEIIEVEPQPWAQPPFSDLVAISGDTCPQGTSNAHHVATLAGLKTCRKEYPTIGEKRKTAPGPPMRP